MDRWMILRHAVFAITLDCDVVLWDTHHLPLEELFVVVCGKTDHINVAFVFSFQMFQKRRRKTGSDGENEREREGSVVNVVSEYC